MKNCKLCKNEVFQYENTIGKPMSYDICLMCWDDLTDKQRQEYIKNGVVPITRLIVDKNWKDYCAKFGLRP